MARVSIARDAIFPTELFYKTDDKKPFCLLHVYMARTMFDLPLNQERTEWNP